ncbi:MAG: hypothetical protein IPL62_18255 [Caulobacteraceae bacterium]|nr:hypothetical protein [Caulobacteraceae bacterium]MBP6688813.1 hypothetical protein [Hyphomonadaceae bacterium]
MNERQRDLFLYEWSRSRTPGQMAISLRGAFIGALGGVLFTLMLIGDIGGDRGNYTGLSAIIPFIERGGALLVMSVGAFAGIGFVLANRVFASQEAMYQSMLATGAQPPAQKPVMQGADRWPAIAVGIAFAVIAGFIAFVWITLG